MTVLPVIARELRVQARLGFTYAIRVLGAAALLCVCLVFWGNYGFSAQLGGRLFGYLNCALVAAIWLLVPLISADCISQERREGTVGLLFLTPLTAREIVLAKGFAHGVRALTLWLAVLPVMTICFLLGGVTWKEAVLSLLLNFSSICWALAAGLLASSMTKPWLRAMALAGAIGGCFAVLFNILVGMSMVQSIVSDNAFYLPFPYQGWQWQNQSDQLQALLFTGFFGITGIEGWWGTMFGSLARSSQNAWLMAEAEVALVSILGLFAASLVAAWNLRRTWQEEPLTERQRWLEQKLFTPVIGVGLFHRWIRRKLERNPIGWLEQRTWSGRLATWGWFAVMISFYTVVFRAPNVGVLAAVQGTMAWMLLGIMAASAAGSFQRERETRVLELLLVSPMSAGQIISGRLRGLWGQFLPSLALLLGVWIYFAGWFHGRNDVRTIPFFCGAFLSLPVIGLHYSLRRKQFIGAFLSTVLTGLLLPWVLKWIASLFAEVFLGFGVAYFGDSGATLDDRSLLVQLYVSVRKTVASPFFIVLLQLGIAVRVGQRLYRDLMRRDFAFSRST